MSNRSINTYCVYCRPGQDKNAEIKLKDLNYSSFSPLEMKPRFVNGKKEKHYRRLMPGYVFFDVPEDTEPEWMKIRQVSSILRVLQYGDGVRALRDDDLKFIHWLRENRGVLNASPVIRIGTKIRIIGGPLKNYEGNIVSVNKQRERVAVKIGEGALLQRIWFSIEYIEESKSAPNETPE